MNADLLLVLGLLVACVGLLIIDKPRMDVVALLVIVILPLTGIISMSEALAGFSGTNVVDRRAIRDRRRADPHRHRLPAERRANQHVGQQRNPPARLFDAGGGQSRLGEALST
jgi:hypothetical protein